jgi:YidC/Oxa1 family membrane protein insertase
LLTLLAFWNPLSIFQPFFNQLVKAMLFGLEAINGVVHNYGWSLIVMAVAIKLAFWYLNATSYKSMGKMQQIQPKIKALQKKYPGKDADTVQKLNAEMMALYKQEGVNPLAGCIPSLIPLPFIIAVYYAIQQESAKFADATWLWIGSPLSQSLSHVMATSLAKPDYILLVFYIVSMYFSVRYATPATSPEQEQQQKIMAFVSPAMIGYFGFQYHWPSGLLIYWIAFNLLTMAQQFYFMRQRRLEYASAVPAMETAAAAVPSAPLSKTQQKKRRQGR